MSKTAKLPEVLTEQLIQATAVIGPERALIALQGLVHSVKPIRIIDGVLRSETVDAVNAFLKINSVEALVLMYRDKIEDRFGRVFEEEDDDEPDEVEVVAVKSRRGR